MAKKKNSHGGKREGAGRPANPDGRAVIVCASVPRELVDQLDIVAAKRGLTRSKAITEAICGLVGRK